MSSDQRSSKAGAQQPPARLSLDTGKEIITLRIPAGLLLEVLEPARVPAVANVATEIERALAAPIGCPRLSAMARPGYKVAIIVCDNTRHAPQQIAIPAIIRELERAGVAAADISIIIACGTHDPMSPVAITEMLGPDIPRRWRVVNHDAYDEAGLVRLGTSRRLGVPIVLNRLAAQADLRIGLGPVDPHIFAGWSGGNKILSVGVAGRDTIAGTHNPAVMEDPGTRYGVIEGNTFRRFLDEAAGIVPLDFILNVVQDSAKQLVRAFAGHAQDAWRAAVAMAGRIYAVDTSHQADIVVSVPTWPKSINLYQAIRAANPAVFGSPPLIRPGGALIIPARCPDGIGSQHFEDDMAADPDAATLLERSRSAGFGPEGNKSFTVSKVILHCSVTISDTDLSGPRLGRMKLGWAADTSSALAAAVARLDRMAGQPSNRLEPPSGPLRLVVLPDGFSILPRLSGAGDPGGK
jgi:nickel-dependent lactate racemase